MSELTGAELYLKNRREDPEYDRAYIAARRHIDQIALKEVDEPRPATRRGSHGYAC